MPSVHEDGYWYVGDENTKVKARGETPQFRKSTSGIEYKYSTEGNSSWRPLVSFYDLRLRYEDLTDEQRESFRLRYVDLKENEIKELQKPAEDAMNELNKEIEKQILAIEMTDNGELVAVTGSDNPYFGDCGIGDDGLITLDFNY